MGLIFFIGLSATVEAQGPGQAQIAFTAFHNGQWDIFTITPDGNTLRQLTNDIHEEATPAFSPDGTQLAYASRRDKNWDIYLLDLASGSETRLTTSPEYEGAPAWHPQGQSIAFESYLSRDPDVWAIDAPFNGEPYNLTADSPAGEFNPAWDDSGQRLFFVSWRAGNNDIWALNLADDTIEAVTSNPSAEIQPLWQPARQVLAFVRDDYGLKDVFQMSADAETQRSWLGSVNSPSFNSDGSQMAAIWRDYDGAYLIRYDEGNPVPTFLSDKIALREGTSWHDNALIAGTEIASLRGPDPSPLYEEILTPSNSPGGEPYNLVRLNDLQLPGDPWLADTVDNSYRAMRSALRDEVGYDFLGEVSETLRPISYANETSQYSSWHKSGRAVDTLFDLPNGNLLIIRENIGGEDYWRIMLRCTDQTGRCGKIITARPWDYSYTARTQLAPDEGGVEMANQFGYYVDFTELAELYGWERIASYDDEEFGWTWHFKAFEYWHYQKRLKGEDGADNWYQAMLQVYPRADVERLFNWQTMRSANEDPYLIMLKGVSPSPQVGWWWQNLVAN